MLNEVVKGLKRTKTDWLSPNLSEPVRAVRTADELARIQVTYTGKVLCAYLPGTGQVNGLAGGGYWGDTNAVGVVSASNPIGGDKPHNNLSPCMAGHMWLRSA